MLDKINNSNRLTKMAYTIAIFTPFIIKLPALITAIRWW